MWKPDNSSIAVPDHRYSSWLWQNDLTIAVTEWGLVELFGNNFVANGT